MALAKRLSRLELIVALLRLVLFILGIALLVATFPAFKTFSLWAILFGLLLLSGVAFLFPMILHDRLIRARDRARRAVLFYEKGIARLENRWIGTGIKGSRYLDGKHPYAEDLDLFGRGSLFEFLCLAVTRIGQDTLARWLMAPASVDEIRQRQEAVKELTPLLDLREDLALVMDHPERQMDPKILIQWAEGPATRIRPLERILAVILSLISIASLMLWVRVGPLPFLGAIAIQSLFSLSLKARVQRITGFAEGASQGLLGYSRFLQRIEQEHYASSMLKRLRSSLGSNGECAGALASSKIHDLDGLVSLLNDGSHNMAWKPFAALLCWSTHLAWAIERWRVMNGPAIALWMAAMGEIEALCSMAGHACEHPVEIFPQISETGLHLEGEGLGHILLAEEKCVGNDLRLDPERQLLMISGSNMSGKSTFLRTVGTSVVLALAGAPVRARRFHLSPLTISASIRNQDSLQEGFSRFYMEIKRVREMFDHTKGPAPLLFLIDEIFQGTNSHDRRIATEAIIRRLLELGAIGLITTHDLALTQIADELAPRAANFHTEDQLIDGTMYFDFQLRPGVIQRGNALALMRSIGLEV